MQGVCDVLSAFEKPRAGQPLAANTRRPPEGGMTTDTFVKAQLAGFAYTEANHTGSLDAMRAVCFIVRNRVRAGWAGGDWNRVINHAPVHAAHEAQSEGPSLESEIFRRLLLQIDEIYQGTAEDNLTEKGMYYCDVTGRAVRDWFAQNIVRDPGHHPRVAQVGMIHIFS